MAISEVRFFLTQTQLSVKKFLKAQKTPHGVEKYLNLCTATNWETISPSYLFAYECNQSFEVASL